MAAALRQSVWWTAVSAALVLMACDTRPTWASAEQQARQILDAVDVRGGLIVHLHCGPGELTAALRANGRYLVQGLDVEPAGVTEARELIRSKGLYGPVSVQRFDGRNLPYADNLVNLVVAEGLRDVPMDEVMRVLRPGGVAMVGGRKTVKPWPDDIDEWSHWRHAADANPVAADRVVGPPRHVQWVAPPRWQTHHDTTPSLNAMVSAGGRVFAIINEIPAGVRGLPGQWRLVARDAFNGVLLWKRPVPEWGWQQWSYKQMAGRFNKPIHLSRRLVAAGDRVYVTLGFNAPVSALDAATGQVVRTYGRTEHTSEIAHKDGTLLLSVNEGPQGPGQVAKKPPVKKRVMALQAETGQIRWEAGPYAGVSSSWDEKERITRLALAAGEDHIVFLDGDDVVALDIETGTEAWRTPRPPHPPIKAQFDYYLANLCALVYSDGVVLLAQPHPVKGHIPYTPTKADLVALSAETGKELWSRACATWGYGTPPDIFVINGVVWAHDAEPYTLMGLDLKTGAEQRRFATTKALRMTHHHRCYRDRATERFILMARRGTEFLGVDDGATILHHWIRGTCRLGIMPANGLLYVPPHPCVCYITAKLNGMYALAPGREDLAPVKEAASPNRLERGDAYGSKPGGQASPADSWPTYRHDMNRSGATACTVPTRLERKWSKDMPGRPSSAIAAGGKVVVASTDAHGVHALDAESGAEAWALTVGGKVDTPPTYHRGLLLFGSADGWVYCVRAEDGVLAWRFRAAPAERTVVDYGQLASAWPLHGSVLIKDDVAYVCAGRSSFLDGGVFLYALNPLTGEVLQETRIYSIKPDTAQMANCELPYDMPPDAPGALSDVMLTDGESVYLRHLRFNPDDLSEHVLAGGVQVLTAAQRRVKARQGPRGYKYRGGHPGLGGQLLSNSGLLDDTWFNQSYWTVGGRGHSRLLVFDANTIYGVRAYKRTRRHARDTFVPGKKGYKLFAMDRKTGKERWARQVAVRIRAMVLAGETLLAAGPPDVVPEDDPWAAFEGRRGAVLAAFGAKDGQELFQTTLDSPPVLDGLIAAEGRLIVSTQDGRVLCLAGEGAADGRVGRGPSGRTETHVTR